MSDPLEIQLVLPGHDTTAVYQALTTTTALTHWFAEFADVDIENGRYNFWGKNIPGTPNQEQGQHPLTNYQPNQCLTYQWPMDDVAMTVTYQLHDDNQGCRLHLIHQIPKHPPSMPVGFEDFWFLNLENLRRYLDGKSPVRLDYNALKLGDFEVGVEIDGSATAVFHTLTNNKALERWIARKANVELKIDGKYDIGWGEGGSVKIVDLVENEKLAYTWEAWHTFPETVTTWTLQESQGKTRLTLVHSGFNDDDDAKGLMGGWLNFLSWVKSVVEYGDDWHPAVKKLTPELYRYYPASMVAKQELFS